MHSAAIEFVECIRSTLGAAPNIDRIVPGRIVRFSANGKRGDDSGWCKLFEDERGGVFGRWGHADEPYTWQSRARNSNSPRAERARVAAVQAAKVEEQAQRHARAAETARSIWTRAESCDAHPYLERKGIQPDGVRVQVAHATACRGRFWARGDQGHTALRGLLLLIPVRDMDRNLWSLQAIDTEGRKSFMSAGRMRGLFHVVGGEKLRGADKDYNGSIAICEGYATGWSIAHELDGWPTFVSFFADNLLPVARAVRARFPRATITICGDNNANGSGQRKAEDAAAAIDALVAIPPFLDGNKERGQTDWNDFACAEARRKEAA